LLVTISGLPGSGTSTVARSVAARLGIEHLDGGTVWRAMAAEAGVSVAEFSTISEHDDRIDLELDARLAARARAGDLLLEARLAGWIVHNERLTGLAVWIAGDPAVRATRVAGRDGLGLDEALAANRAREASEAARYRTYYGIDIADLTIYDLVLDSSSTPAEALEAEIVAGALAT
jgi:cytidylate kinase